MKDKSEMTKEERQGAIWISLFGLAILILGFVIDWGILIYVGGGIFAVGLCNFLPDKGNTESELEKIAEEAKRTQAVEKKKAEDALKLKEVEPFWPYGDKTVLVARAINDAPSGLMAFKFEQAQLSVSKGLEFIVGKDSYNVFVKESGLIVQKDDDFYRISDTELNLEQKWIVCDRNELLKRVIGLMDDFSEFFVNNTFVKGDKFKDITDPDILDLIKKINFKYDGGFFSSEEINIAKEFVYKVIEKEPQSYSKVLFDFYLAHGISHFDISGLTQSTGGVVLDSIFNTDISASAAEQRESSINRKIREDDLAFQRFRLNYSGSNKDCPPLPSDPINWATFWATREIAFNYFKRLIQQNKLKLQPISTVLSNNLVSVTYGTLFDVDAWKLSRGKNEFGIQYSAISRFNDIFKEKMDCYTDMIRIATLTWNLESGNFERLEVLDENYYIFKNEANKEVK